LKITRPVFHFFFCLNLKPETYNLRGVRFSVRRPLFWECGSPAAAFPTTDTQPNRSPAIARDFFALSSHSETQNSPSST
jgi:hypothetical protein